MKTFYEQYSEFRDQTDAGVHYLASSFLECLSKEKKDLQQIYDKEYDGFDMNDYYSYRPL